MTWWDIRGKQLWHGIEGNFCSAGQRQSLKTIKAALSQLHKFSSCSRWTLFVSWFILPECIRNMAQLSRSHLMHPSEMFSITERSWEKNCWLQQGLTFKKEKKKKKRQCFGLMLSPHFCSSRKQQFITSVQRTAKLTHQYSVCMTERK